jgi:hypothetical protein
MRSILRRLSRRHSTAVAYLALFAALGGSAYAAVTVTGKNIKDGTVSSKDLRNNDIRSKDVRDRSLLAQDFKAGELPAGAQGPEGPKGDQGPEGDQGAPATRLFAYIRVDGGNVAEVAYGQGVTQVEQVGVEATVGEFDVHFNRDLRECVVQVTPGTGRPRGSTISYAHVTTRVFIDPNDAEGDSDNQARVLLNQISNGAPVDQPFMITAFC